MPAPKGNKNAAGNKGGKGGPAKYKPEYAKIAKQMYALGATDYEVAEAFEVSNTTIKRWLNTHVEFALSYAEATEHCDNRVEKALYHKATGYTFESEKIFQFQGEVVRAKTVEHVPPDTTAAQFWLKNRRKENWRDKQEVESTQNVNVTVTHVRDNLSRKLDRIATQGTARGLAEQPVSGRA